jgi:imidazolonepropionase-like amidohydrolase
MMHLEENMKELSDGSLSLPTSRDGSVKSVQTLVRAGRLIDGINHQPILDSLILIEGDRIKSVGRNIVVPPGCEEIDLSAYTVLPGLIDAHTHVCFAPQDGKDPVLTKSVAFRALQGAAAARAALNAGFTTLRDTDSEGAGFADVAVRDAIQQGLIPGPRLFVSTLGLSITGGHMNLNGLAPEIDALLPQVAALADNLEEMIRAVRQQVKYGTDWVKIYATSTLRQIDQKTLESIAQFSEADIRVVVQEAARWRKDVAAHAYGGEGAKAAVRAGVRSIEHGMFLDDETLELMAERDVFWCPTFANMRPEYALVGYSEDFVRRLMGSHREVFRRALQLGVKIAFGTDAGRFPHGSNADEFDLMVAAGMSPMKAIQTATTVAAELLRMENELGSIKAGCVADLIAVSGNPLDDISILHEVPFVLKSGRIVKAISTAMRQMGSLSMVG